MKQCCMGQFNEQDIHCCHDDEKDPLNEDRQPEEHSYSQVPKCAWQNNVLRQGAGTVIVVGWSVERHVCCGLHRAWHIPPTSKLERQIEGNLVLSPRIRTCSRHDKISRHNITSRHLNPLQLVCTEFLFDVRESVHHHTIRIIQPIRCNSFTSLLLDVYVWLNMFQASPRPSSGAYNCTRSLWFYRWRAAVEALLVVVWQVITCQTTTNNAPAAALQPEAPSAVACS